jgi:hypothetical protein
MSAAIGIAANPARPFNHNPLPNQLNLLNSRGQKR